MPLNKSIAEDATLPSKLLLGELRVPSVLGKMSTAN